MLLVVSHFQVVSFSFIYVGGTGNFNNGIKNFEFIVGELVQINLDNLLAECVNR